MICCCARSNVNMSSARRVSQQRYAILNRRSPLDPSYAPAMALAALCHAERRDQSWMKDPEGEEQEALDLASRAVELGKDDANVLWMGGYTILRFEMDQLRAQKLVRHSLELNPNSAIACAIAGEMEANLGNTGEALELLSRAMRLSPRDPRGWFILSKMAWAHYVGGQYAEAISVAREVLSQNPYSAYALRFLAASLAKLGQLKDGAETIQDVLKIEPGLTLTRLRARLMFIDKNIWQDYSAALRLAGLPE
jgi:tetratricopeptide (TPR) repeat protein